MNSEFEKYANDFNDNWNNPPVPPTPPVTPSTIKRKTNREIISEADAFKSAVYKANPWIFFAVIILVTVALLSGYLTNWTYKMR